MGRLLRGGVLMAAHATRVVACGAALFTLLYASVGLALADPFVDGQSMLLGSPGSMNFVQMGNGIATGNVTYGQGGQGGCDTTKGTVCANDVLPSQYNQGTLQQFSGQYGGTGNAQALQGAAYQQQLNDKAAAAGGNGSTPAQWLYYSANQGAANRNLGTSIGSSAADNFTQINKGGDPAGQTGLMSSLFSGCTSTSSATGGVAQNCSGVVQCLGNSCYNPGSESNADFGSFAAAAQIINGIHTGMVCQETGKPPSQTNSCTPQQITKLVYVQDPNQPDCPSCTIPVSKKQDICQETGKPVQISCGGTQQDLDGTIANDIPPSCQLYAAPEPVGAFPANCTPTVFQGQVNECNNYLGSGVGLTNNCCAMGAQAAGSLNLVALISLSDMIPGVKQLKTQLATQVQDALSPLTNAVRSVGQSISDFAGQLQGGLSNMLSSGSVGAGLGTEALGAGAGSEIQAGAQLSVDGSGSSISTGITDFIKNQLTELVGPQVAQNVMQAYEMFNTAMMIYTVASTIGKFATACSPDELQLGVKQKNKLCVTMPSYCSANGGFVCAVETTKACCYSSMVSRVLAQQIKKQISAGAPNGGFGPSDNPDCGGFSPAQLANVDWTKVDLSEWLDTLQQTGFGLPQNAQDVADRVNATGNTPTSMVSYYLGGNGPAVDQQQNVKTRADQLSADGKLEASRANATLTQPTCYTDPSGIPTYQGPPVAPTDVIVSTGAVQSDYGFDQITNCSPTVGAHCIQLNLGKQADDYIHDNCTRLWNQIYNFKVLRPDLIVRAHMTDVEWDDDINIRINGQDVFTSAYYYSSSYFKPGGSCEHTTSWRAFSPPLPYQVVWDPPGTTTPGFLDLTPVFQRGGIVSTQTSLLVGGGGEGYAVIQIEYNDPPYQTPTNCIAPPQPK
ncbi:conjugal transfer protein TraN [Burkholderia sp. Bp9017]|uniref:conjugal transfer protein TraN n=1 Tax=unclassified Burkholderia TaxID=2613784 RepID=UPI000F5F97F3|nr:MULTISPECIES: conjugal transfer protein TraN [unclassified Burkholderia]RQZ31615.1 conjugal transfer protein TraN [Burkholderia sp. Bp9017]RQZ37746.1 conjugal transfer protein TraN [Burkholderia sp. Bp9016]